MRENKKELLLEHGVKIVVRIVWCPWGMRDKSYRAQQRGRHDSHHAGMEWSPGHYLNLAALIALKIFGQILRRLKTLKVDE